jgi:hypothetical protein
MGFFDRLLGRVEQQNTEAVYASARDGVQERIDAQRAQLASLRVDLARYQDADPVRVAGYPALIAQAERAVEALLEEQRALELERLVGPAAKAVAEARVRVADDDSGLGPDASSAALSSVRDEVAAKLERASGGYLDANGIPIHGRQAALDRKHREAEAREQLEQMKRALADRDDDA